MFLRSVITGEETRERGKIEETEMDSFLVWLTESLDRKRSEQVVILRGPIIKADMNKEPCSKTTHVNMHNLLNC